MKHFTSSLLLTLTILSGTASFAQSPLPAESNKGVPARTASDTADVQHVTDAYHEAVLTHDGSRLAHLFIPQGSMWLNVLSDEAYARAKAKISGCDEDSCWKLHRFREGGFDLKGQLQSDAQTSAGDGKEEIAGARLGSWLKEPMVGG